MRNARRNKKVPEHVIDNMYDKAIASGHKFTEYDDYTYEPDPSKPTAFIFDMD